MPFSVMKLGGKGCPKGKEWGVVTKGSGKLHGCHESRESAEKQMAALYANEADED